MADDGRNRRIVPNWIYPGLTTNVAATADTDLAIDVDESIFDLKENRDNDLEKKIEQIIQQKLSDLLLSHVCPVCKKQLEE